MANVKYYPEDVLVEKVQSGEHIVEQGLSGGFSQGFGLVMLGGMAEGIYRLLHGEKSRRE